MKKPPHSTAFTLLELAVVVAILAVLASLLVMNTGNMRENAETTAARSTLNTIREAIVGSPGAAGYLIDMKYVPGFRTVNMRTHDLLSSSSYPNFAAFDLVANRGWRGPYLNNAQGAANTNKARDGAFPASNEIRFPGDTTYLTRGFFTDVSNSPYGFTGDLVAADPWGNPIVLQVPPASAFNGSTGDAKVFRYARLVSAGPDGVLSTPLDRLGGMLSDGTSSARGDDIVIFLNRTDVYEVEEP